MGKVEKPPKVEREAEMKEAIKKYQQAEDLRQQIINRGGDPDGPYLPPEYSEILSGASQEVEIDVLTGETADIGTVGHSDEKHIPPFPFWDIAEPTRENEAVGGHFFDTGGGEFNSNPETLSPLNLDSALVTDAYQQQDAPGADLIACEANQEMDPSQTQRVQYEDLA